jgi:transketolase
MDIAVLTTFLAPFLPYLMKLGGKAAEGAAGKLGEDAWNKAKAVWSKLSPKVEASSEVKVAAEQVAAKPDSQARQSVLQEELEALLQQNPELAEAIARIMREDAADGTPGIEIVQKVTGEKNQTIGQMYGGKAVGNVEGDVTM